MSLVTRCPACQTTFKVVRDQLRISDGWVRCGRCSEVFDATQDLTDTDTGERVAPGSFVSPPPPPLDDPLPSGMPPDAEDDDAWSTGADSSPFDGLAAGLSDFPAPTSPDTLDDIEVRPLPEANWPNPQLLDLRAAPAAVEPNAVVEGTSADAQTASAARSPSAPTWRQIQAPPGLTTVVADEPWPLRPESALPPASKAAVGQGDASSPFQAAVDAQLQKALRRARIDAVREGRLRQQKAAQARHEADSEEAPNPNRPEVAPEQLTTVLRQASDENAPNISARGATRGGVSAFSAADASPIVTTTQPSVQTSPKERLPAGRGKAFALAALSLVALAVLALQYLRHERDHLAATQPAMRPLIEALCQSTGCEVRAPRRIDAVRIDGSSFTPDRTGEHFQLMFTLRNTAATRVAMPSIELSLLDANERPLIRRVFHPKDFGVAAEMSGRGDVSAQLDLNIEVPAGQHASVVGYSMLAFYP